MMREFANFRGHSREVTCCEWHPAHEELFVSGASDGTLMYWMASRPEAQAKITNAHDTAIWSLSWHPLGHLLATGTLVLGLVLLLQSNHDNFQGEFTSRYSQNAEIVGALG